MTVLRRRGWLSRKEKEKEKKKIDRRFEREVESPPAGAGETPKVGRLPRSLVMFTCAQVAKWIYALL